MSQPTVAVPMDPESWDAGYLAGVDGLPQHPVPAGVKDRLAFFAGWIEGEADRHRKRQQPAGESAR